MSSEWQQMKWGNLITLEYGKSLKGYKEGCGEYQVFGTNGPIGWTDKYLTEGPSIIIGRKGAYRGVEYSEKPFYVIDTAFYVDPKEDFDMLWAYYQMLTIDIDGMDSGSAIPSTSRDEFYQLPVKVPPLDVQKEIANHFKTLDQKIHLNQQTNETLETMAQAIFKSWFVDFDPVRAKIEATSTGHDPNRAAMAAIAGVSLEQDWDKIEATLQQKLSRMTNDQRTQLHQTAELFPYELVESEIGMVPKGWGYSIIGKEFDIVNGQSPPGSTYNEEGEGVPFYQGRTDFGFRFPTQRVYCTKPKRFAKKGDTLLSVRAPVGDLNIAIEDCCIGRGLASLRHKTGSISYTYYAMKQIQAQIEAYEATGTVFGSINQKQLKALDTIAPDNKVIDEFHRIIDPIDSKIMNQVSMNRGLSELRDTLLPKLISGDFKI